MKIKIGEKVLAPSYMAHVRRHHSHVVGRVLDIITEKGLRLIQVWQYNHEPKCMAGWFESSELKTCEHAEKIANA